MGIEERNDYIDIVAQAVIDKIEEHDRLGNLVNLVANRVLELQGEQDRLFSAPIPVVPASSEASKDTVS